VVFGLSGKVFFWELATLIDVMLLGHWFEMKSIMATSSALEEMAKLKIQIRGGRVRTSDHLSPIRPRKKAATACLLSSSNITSLFYILPILEWKWGLWLLGFLKPSL
jgi:hypothetical protein